MDLSPAVFFSYARADDESEHGRISGLRKKLETELRVLSGDAWDVFQDLEDVEIGQQWRSRLAEGLNGSTFFVPILTPTYFKRPFCREELAQFLEREKELGRDDLVIPVLYLNTPVMTDAALESSDPLASVIAARQRDDWRQLRHHSLKSARIKERITQLAEAILSTHRRISRGPNAAPAAGLSPSSHASDIPRLRKPNDTHDDVRNAAPPSPIGSASQPSPAPRVSLEREGLRMSHLKRWTIVALIAGIVSLLAVFGLTSLRRPVQPGPAANVDDPQVTTTTVPTDSSNDGWLPGDEYQKAFEAQTAGGLYPSRVDGRLNGDRDEFRAVWKEAPPGCSYVARHGLTQEDYEQANTQHTAEGLTLTTMTQFTNSMGIQKYQAVWSRNCNP